MKKETIPFSIMPIGYADYPHSRVLESLEITYNWQSNLLDNFFKQFQLSRQQYNILFILHAQQPIPVSINDIKRGMIDKMSNVSRLVEKLRLKSLVTRREYDKDRRVCLVELTTEGGILFGKIAQQLPEFFEQFGTLPEEEALLLIQLLEKFKSNNKVIS
jgi:DNA-binding MarR family transcriptional regulator